MDNLHMEEYKQACEFIRFELKIRRVALAFVAAVQTAIIAAILQFEAYAFTAGYLKNFALPLLGLFIAVIGYNNEWRIKKYLNGYTERAHELERDNLNFTLLGSAYKKVEKQQGLFTSSAHNLFLILFGFMIILWIIYLSFIIYEAANGNGLTIITKFESSVNIN